MFSVDANPVLSSSKRKGLYVSRVQRDSGIKALSVFILQINFKLGIIAFIGEIFMKKIIQVVEVEGEGLKALMGKKVMLFCLNYIYTGTLTGVNDTCVLLEDASIVYETGAFSSDKFTDAQKLPHNLYVQTSAIESFGETNKK